jgi:hypothetical protein
MANELPSHDDRTYSPQMYRAIAFSHTVSKRASLVHCLESVAPWRRHKLPWIFGIHRSWRTVFDEELCQSLALPASRAFALRRIAYGFESLVYYPLQSLRGHADNTIYTMPYRCRALGTSYWYWGVWYGERGLGFEPWPTSAKLALAGVSLPRIKDLSQRLNLGRLQL